MFDTETIDRLFLELSQFTKATTKKELELQETIKKLEDRMDRLSSEVVYLRKQEHK